MRPIIQLKQNINYLCFVLFLIAFGCQDENYKKERIQADIHLLDKQSEIDSTINAFVKPYRNRLTAEMDSVLAYAPKSLSKKDSRYNTAIGNMMADAVFELANPIFQKRKGSPFDAVLLNYGGIRASLNQGVVTTRTAYNIMPFENEIVVVELNSTQINEMFEYLEQGTAHPIAGMAITLDAAERVKTSKTQGKVIEEDKTYFIATTDYLQQGGDHMDFLTQPLSIINLDYKMRTVLIDYFKKYDTIAPVVDDRFIRLAN